MNFLDEKISLRMHDGQLREIDKYIEKYPELWEDRSIFVRAACNHFINCPLGLKNRLHKVEVEDGYES